MQTETEQLSSAFSKILRQWLTPEEMEDINTANELSADPRLCESHKYCDAHEAMSQAFQLTFSRSIDYRYDTDTNMINEAWGISKAMKFLN